jgi:hypothetical protein
MHGRLADRAASLAERATLVLPLGLATDERLVSLDSASQRAVLFLVLVEHGADLVEHAPCRLVGDAKLPLQLLCRDPAASLAHEEDGVEPEPERRGRPLEDCAFHRVHMVAAELAGVRRARLHPMMLGHALALGAENAVRVQAGDEPI